MSMKRSKALKVIRERIQFLNGRTDSYRRAEKEPLPRDLAEIGALIWLLDQVRTPIPQVRVCKARVPITIGNVETFSTCGVTLPCPNENHSSDVDPMMVLLSIGRYDEVRL